MKKLSLALFTLALLSACGERGASSHTGEKPSAETEQADVAADAAKRDASDAAEVAKEERAQAALAEAAAKRAAAYKRALLPLVAASYAGECTTGAGVKSHAAISVTADGTVSAPGMKASSIMEADAMLMVNRGASSGSAPTMTFMAGSDANKWNLLSRNTADEAAAYGSNNVSMRCLDQGGAAQTKPGNVYPAVAKFFIAASRSLKCTGYQGLPKVVKVTPTATQVTVGDDTFALVRADAGEGATVTDTEKALTYQTGVIDGIQIALQLDQTGALSFVSVLGAPGGKSFNCEPDKQ